MSEMIRFAAARDAGPLLSIYAPYVERSAVSFEYSPPTLVDFSARIENTIARLPWLVYEVDGQAAGYAYASRHMSREAYQWNAELSVYISPAFHRRGMARKLCESLFRLLKEQGYLNVYSLITLPNDQSIGLHHFLGFRELGVYRSTGYKHGQWRDVAILEKQLTELPETPLKPKSIWELDPDFVADVLRLEK